MISQHIDYTQKHSVLATHSCHVGLELAILPHQTIRANNGQVQTVVGGVLSVRVKIFNDSIARLIKGHPVLSSSGRGVRVDNAC